MAEKKSKAKKGFWGSIKAFFGRIVKFFRDTKSELKKITWPGKKQIINNTMLVLVVVLLSAALIYLLDLGFGSLLKWIVQ